MTGEDLWLKVKMEHLRDQKEMVALLMEIITGLGDGPQAGSAGVPNCMMGDG